MASHGRCPRIGRADAGARPRHPASPVTDRLRVRQGRITLGTVRVDDAARLARLLGAVPPAVDLSDADTVRTVLGQAFPRATGGGILSVSARADAPEVLELGSIDARTARRLISALRF